MNIPITIPSQDDYSISTYDTVTFTFSQDVEEFSTDHRDAFDPPLPSGGFVEGNVIGPYTAKKPNVDVHFDADLRQMHTIHIGN